MLLLETPEDEAVPLEVAEVGEHLFEVAFLEEEDEHPEGVLVAEVHDEEGGQEVHALGVAQFGQGETDRLEDVGDGGLGDAVLEEDVGAGEGAVDVLQDDVGAGVLFLGQEGLVVELGLLFQFAEVAEDGPDRAALAAWDAFADTGFD